ncbi:hypothetical protein ACGFR8_07715 [Streptomyces brevispora]|uniref:hypothetical protein n=1 Tax=Streptomyces brevispora TaxID=887462 RepID=UPI0037136789
MNLTSARRAARTVTIAAVATLLLTGCVKSSPSTSSKSTPTCPTATRTATGDLVPRGPRPCLLTTSHGDDQAPAAQDTAPATRQPATPDFKASAKESAPDKQVKQPAAPDRLAKQPAPAPAKKSR